MSRNSAENFVSNTAAAIVGGGLIAGFAMLTPALLENFGKALTTLLWLVVIAGGVAFFVAYNYYVDVLGSGTKAKGSRARQAYDTLRRNLGDGGLPAQLYAERLTRFLGRVDRFFGDDGMASKTLFPHAFGLKTPAPLWTAQAFDRCLLLALVYPMLAILVFWVASGHVGPAERVLGFGVDVPLWRRAIALGMLPIIAVALRKGTVASGWRSFVLFAVAAAVAFAVAFAVADAVAVATAVAVALAIAGVGAVAVASAVAVAVAIAGAGAVAAAVTAAVAAAVTAAVAAAALYVMERSIDRDRQGIFLALFTFLVLVSLLFVPLVVSWLSTWPKSGPLLLFLGLLTLLNAPFDWFSLGLTRALLRRGIELGGWWPYCLAVIDAILAAAVIAALACVMIVGVQTFDFMAVLGHGKPILPLDALLQSIALHPGAPEYWWVYALLLSTMIPSLVNLVIGGASLTRGIPGVPSWLLRFMPAGRSVSTIDRHWIALVLTSQWLAGAVLGIGAQVFLVWIVFRQLMPLLGFDLLDMARWVVALDIPSHVYRLFP